jgi:hypothetical protein
MIFTLEALKAKHGDSLLLHYGDPSSPQLIVIDGGPGGVYKKVLKTRLEEIKASRFPDERLPIRLLMVSHIDDDHIAGVLDLSHDLVNLQEIGTELPYDIETLWHNSFDDIVGNQPEELFASLKTAVMPVATGGAVPSGLPLSRPGAAVVAGVPQSRTLRQNAKRLSLNINFGFAGLVLAPKSGEKTVKMGSRLNFTVIGPDQQKLEDLQEEWDKQLKKMKKAKTREAMVMAAAFIDKSVFNLSSIVVLAQAGNHRMLLTGDARGDEILEGLKKLGLLKSGRLHVDLLKVPHHGSDRNVSTDFFRQITADHYIISADGKYGNPEIATLKMMSEARGKDAYKVYLTNKETRLEDFYKREKASRKKCEYIFGPKDAWSVKVDLDDPLKD